MIFEPNQMWTPKSVLSGHAAGIRSHYWRTGTFWEKHKVQAYVEESRDWGIWLHVVGELFGRMIHPGKYLNQCIAKPSVHFPRPSELLKDCYLEQYSSWLEGEVRLGMQSDLIWPFQHEINDIDTDVQLLLYYWEDFPPEEPLPECRLERLEIAFNSRCIVEPKQDTSLEEFVYVSLKGIADRVCDEHMFVESVMKYYPLKDVFNAGKFFREFEPVAKKAYLQFTDFSAVDLERLEGELTRRYPKPF